MPDDIPSIATFSQTVGSIYDCALDPARWPDAIREICDSLGCVRGLISVNDIGTGGMRMQKHWNCGPDWLEAMTRYAPEITEVVAGVPDFYTRPLDEPLLGTRDFTRLYQSRY